MNERTIFITTDYNSGPVVVVDEARGPAGAEGAVTWHLVGRAEMGAYRFRLGESSGSAEVLLLPLSEGGRAEALERAGGSSGLDVAYSGISHFRAATVFLYGPWVGAEVGMEEEGVQVAREGQMILVPISELAQQ